MEAAKVTSAEWLMNNMGEHIDDFAKKIGVPGLHGPSLFAHFAWVAQYGGDANEFWIALDDKNKPIAFANWLALALPHVSKVYMPFLHAWENKTEAPRLLIDKFLEFGDRNNATWFMWEPISEKHLTVLERELKRVGQKLMKTGTIHCLSWKVKS
jgi:hypothetical protein